MWSRDENKVGGQERSALALLVARSPGKVLTENHEVGSQL